MAIEASRFFLARVLVVDDSIFERQLISIALKQAGFTNLVMADDGEDALRKTYEYRPDVVLLDLCMPQMDGFGYCDHVRRDQSLPKMPIIVQTALEDRATRLRALSCGADDFLTKPLDMTEMALRLRIHVERYFMFRDVENMCGYLKMEIETVETLRSIAEAESFPKAGRDSLDNHFEVLSQLLRISEG